MKILQFNIQFGCPYPDRAGETDSDLAAVVEQVRRINPDIVFFQEVEQGREGGKQIEPAPNYEYLKAALSDYDSYFSYPPEDPEELPFGIGLAIFSKLPLQKTFRHVLPAPDFQFEFNGKQVHPTQRVLIGADVDVEGQRIRLLNTHLQAFFIVNRVVKDFPSQREEAGEVVKASPYPVILAGDFNSAPGEDTVEYFEGLGLKTVQNETITWHRMPYVLDHVFHTPHFECREWEVIPSMVSDHMPLRVNLDLVSS